MKSIKNFQSQQKLSSSTMSHIYGGRVVKSRSKVDNRVIDKAWYRGDSKVPYKTWSEF